MSKFCNTCRFHPVMVSEDPCNSCRKHDRWLPKEEDANNNTNLTEKDKNMRTQEIYTGIVTENEKIKDDNGQIESIKKRVIYSTFDTPAFDEANAKVKIMAAASKVQGKNAIKDLDEVEVKVRPFLG